VHAQWRPCGGRGLSREFGIPARHPRRFGRPPLSLTKPGMSGGNRPRRALQIRAHPKPTSCGRVASKRSPKPQNPSLFCVGSRKFRIRRPWSRGFCSTGSADRLDNRNQWSALEISPQLKLLSGLSFRSASPTPLVRSAAARFLVMEALMFSGTLAHNAVNPRTVSNDSDALRIFRLYVMVGNRGREP
jgi:hypothetical protein